MKITKAELIKVVKEEIKKLKEEKFKLGTKFEFGKWLIYASDGNPIDGAPTKPEAQKLLKQYNSGERKRPVKKLSLIDLMGNKYNSRGEPLR